MCRIIWRSKLTRSFRKWLATAGLAVLVVLVAAGIAPAAADSPYLLLYAFDHEGDAIAAHMTIIGTDTILGRVVRSGTASGKQVVLAESGVGMTNAAMTSQRLIDQYHPVAVLFTGIAGAIDSSVRIGDIVVASSWIQHDYGYIGADGFELDSLDAFDSRRRSISRILDFPVDSTLLSVARECSQSHLALDSVGTRKPAVIVGGAGVSGNTFIDSKEKREWLSQHLNARIVDMESAAVVHVCLANGVRVLVMRSTSDLAGGSGSSTAAAEMNRFLKIAAKNSAAVVLDILKRIPSTSSSN